MPSEHKGLTPHGGGELERKPGLPDPGRAEDGEEVRSTIGDGLVECMPDSLELASATDDLCLEPACERRDVLHADHPPRRPDIAIAGAELRRLGFDRVPNQSP